MPQGITVPELQIDHHLIDWPEIEGKIWKSLLLGNGFSINIWDHFEYGSLFEVSKGANVDEKLSENSIALFDLIGSTNFEDVLRILFHARLVDQQLGSPQAGQIEQLYTNTKNSLASAVSYAHVQSWFPALKNINKALRSFSNVFTTNYDLIPYWAIMYEDTWRFKDLFWGEETTFDPKNTAVNADRCVISYLHGAIHLVELPNGKTKKLTANGIATLTELFDLTHPEQFPLFISEGSSERKLSRIKRNDYLRFAFEKFTQTSGNLIVLGHALHKDYDQHILDALKSSQIEAIAVSVWPNQKPKDILSFKLRILSELHGKELYFFNSTTHPLGAQELRVEA